MTDEKGKSLMVLDGSSSNAAPAHQKYMAVGGDLDLDRVADGNALVAAEERRLGRPLTIQERLRVVEHLYW